jgi:CheY-like chemotaxis protein
VATLVANLSALVEQAFGSDHRFELVLDDRVQCVTSDANQLELALLNLALNGRDASPKGSTITLAVAPVEQPTGADPPYILFRMIDRGAGMDEETRRKAIEPFFTTKPIGRGTGLGLAQVLGVVEQSGGTVAIDSAPGEGTIVSIRLPGCSAPAAIVGKPAASPLPAEILPLRLLVVDDDPAVRATTARLLEAVGHSVDSVSHATTALAALAAEPFDLVIVDFAMPGMNGAELLQQARLVRPDLRALVISGYSDTEALAATGVGAPILPKPFSSDQLLEAVGRAAAG